MAFLPFTTPSMTWLSCRLQRHLWHGFLAVYNAIYGMAFLPFTTPSMTWLSCRLQRHLWHGFFAVYNAIYDMAFLPFTTPSMTAMTPLSLRWYRFLAVYNIIYDHRFKNKTKRNKNSLLFAAPSIYDSNDKTSVKGVLSCLSFYRSRP